MKYVWRDLCVLIIVSDSGTHISNTDSDNHVFDCGPQSHHAAALSLAPIYRNASHTYMAHKTGARQKAEAGNAAQCNHE